MIVIRRAKLTKGRRHQQALGLTDTLRNRLIEAAPDTLTGLRNITLISEGYVTLCRSAELCVLRLEDAEAMPDGSRSILIRRTKNDPVADGRFGMPSPAIIAHLNRWLTAAGIGSGWMCRRVQADGTVGDAPLDPASINRILKTMAADAAFDATQIARLSGHSMRVGAAKDMMTSGLCVLAITEADDGNRSAWSASRLSMSTSPHWRICGRDGGRVVGCDG